MIQAGTKTIRTERLTLRRFELADAETMFRNWVTDEEVTRYLRFLPHKNVDETRSILYNWIEDYEKDNTYLWGICLNSGELIGSIGMFIKESDYQAEIGYCIGRSWWGNGYISEALKAVVDYMFTNTDIERIEAYHAVENPASGKVMANAGMAHEGFVRHKYKNHNGFHDCNLYGIVRKMWEEQNGKAQ